MSAISASNICSDLTDSSADSRRRAEPGREEADPGRAEGGRCRTLRRPSVAGFLASWLPPLSASCLSPAIETATTPADDIRADAE